MADHDPELADDAPLRRRVWWAFWRRWRVVLGALVLLVVVAWWTRPGPEAHFDSWPHRELGDRTSNPGLIRWYQDRVLWTEGGSIVDFRKINYTRGVKTLGLLGMVFVVIDNQTEGWPKPSSSSRR